MKALLFTKEYPPYVYGGAGVHVEYLSREMAKIIPVEVRSFGDQDLDGNNLKVKGYKVIKDNIFYNTDPLLKPNFEALFNCIGFNVDKIDADVAHCHTWYTHFAGIMAKIMLDIPLVITTHSLEPLRPWKREQLGGGYDFSSWTEKTALEMADAIIAVSKDTKNDVLKHFNVDEKKVHIIPNGIDTDEFKKVSSKEALIKYKIDAKSPYILFVGRITRQKGIVHLVNAIKYINPDVQIVLCAGQPDTDDIAKEMQAAVDNISVIRDNVIWIQEMLPKKDLIEIYSHASIFCCPSIYEPFGIINLEAMACEVPVVASAVGGIKEIVVENETGLLVKFDQINEAPFEPKNPDEYSRLLAEKINYLIENEDLRKKMGEQGRKLAVEKYSWYSIAEKIVNLYRTLIKK